MSRINESALRTACIREHGEPLGAIVYRQSLDAHREFERQYDAMIADKAATEKEIEQFQSRLPSLAPLRTAMDNAYAFWLAACLKLEDQRIQNEAACSTLTQKRSELQTRIAMHTSLGGTGTWEKSTLFPAPLPEHTSDFHTAMHAQQRKLLDE